MSKKIKLGCAQKQMSLQSNALINWSGCFFPNWDKTPKKKQSIALVRTRLAN